MSSTVHGWENDNTDLEIGEVFDLLRKWASGSLPFQAAVDFLAQAEVHPGPFLAVEWSGYIPMRAWLDLFGLDAATWRQRTGYMSGGERATWALVRSVLDGELEAEFWRMDGTRKSAFLQALARYA